MLDSLDLASARPMEGRSHQMVACRGTSWSSSLFSQAASSLCQLVSALRANNSDTFRRWLSGGIQDLGRPAVEELMLEWMNPLLTVEEMDGSVGWHLEVSI